LDRRAGRRRISRVRYLGRDPRRGTRAFYRRSRKRISGRGDAARVRALCDHQRQRHRTRARHRQEDRRGASRPRNDRESAPSGSAGDFVLSARRGQDVIPQPKEILVVDDEVGIRELLSEILQDEGYRVSLAEDAGSARSYRSKFEPALVLLDIWMPDTDGVTLLREWAANGQLTMPVVIMSGHGTIETAVEATKIGAFDFLEKPIGLQKLLSTVSRALKAAAGQGPRRVSLAALGTSAPVIEIERAIEQLLRANRTILLIGEPGTGHEIVARARHASDTPLVALTSGARS